jgi:hypothetical protein
MLWSNGCIQCNLCTEQGIAMKGGDQTEFRVFFTKINPDDDFQG